jgi:hypothetical protein
MSPEPVGRKGHHRQKAVALLVAVVAFGLSPLTKNSFLIVSSGFVLATAVLALVVASRIGE